MKNTQSATRLCLILLLLLSVPRSASGFDIRGTLEGRVVDKETGEPLIGVNIQIMGTYYGGATDAEGFYEIGGIYAGVYDVRISMIGYKILVIKGVIIRPDLRTRHDLELEAATIELETVEIRAPVPLIQKDLAATAFSISAPQLETLPLSTFKEVLFLQPGTTAEGNVRGGKTSETLYLIDGLPVQDLMSGGLGASLPKSSITGMTVYTGGFEAEYGSALSGVVNVITKSGVEHHEARARVETDGAIPARWNEQQDKRTEVDLSASGPILPGRLFYVTANNVVLSDTRWWQDFDRVFRSPVSREFSGFGKLEYHASPSFRFALQGLYSYHSWRDYEFSWRFNLGGLPARSTGAFRVAATLTHSLSNSTYYAASASLYSADSQIGDREAGIALSPYQYDLFLRYVISGRRNWWADSRQRNYTLKADLTHSIERAHLFKLGFEFNQHDIFSDLVKYEPQLTYFGKPRENTSLLNYSNRYSYQPRSGAVYVQDKIELERDGASFSLGLRWDFLDPRARRPIVEYIPGAQNEYEQVVKGSVPASLKSIVSPRFGFAAPVAPETFCFFNFGSYVQFPLFDYLYSGLKPAQIRSGTRSVLAGNSDLAAERMVAWEAGFKRGITEHEVMSITYFAKVSKNQIDSKTLVPFDSKFAGDYGFAQYVNNAETKAEGVEFVLSRENDERLSGSFSYTFMWAEGLSEYADQGINYAQWGFPLVVAPYPLSWDQRHTIKINATVGLLSDMGANVVLLYNSPRPYTYYPTRDGFNPSDPTKALLPNNDRMEDVFFVHVKAWRDFLVGSAPEMRLRISLDARNLLNRKNVRWVDSNGRIGGELGDPSAYYDPRRIRLGIAVSF
ncbi:MAG TPA: TonB-dependent receptor [Bacteroidota bacterium]